MPTQSAAQSITESTAKRLPLTGDSPVEITVPYLVSLDDGDTSRALSIGVTYDTATGKLLGDGVLYDPNHTGVIIPLHLVVKLLGGLAHPASPNHVLNPETRDRLDLIAEATRAERGTL